jgi:hypothetical protein
MSTVHRTKIGGLKTRKVIILLILWIFLFWVFVCWAIWDGAYTLTALAFNNPPRWKPLASDIVGKWHLSEDSINMVENLGAQVPFHEIEFFIDGTFIATDFPNAEEWSDEKIVLKFYTGTGTWEIDRMRFKPWSVKLYYDDYVEFFRSGDYYFLIGKESPYKMDDTPLIFERK